MTSPEPIGETSRLLLLSSSFPPRAEVGAARWEGLVRYFATEHIHADVVSESVREGEKGDEERLASLPSTTRVTQFHRSIPHWHQWLLGKLAARARRSVSPSLPMEPGETSKSKENSVRWRTRIRRSLGGLLETISLRAQGQKCIDDIVALAERLCHDNKYDFVVSSGPPHFAHIAAHRIARSFSMPHVVDLRDPWADRRDTDLARRVFDPDFARNESHVLHGAALVVANTPAAAGRLRERFPDLADRIVAIMNGVDLPVQERREAVSGQFTVVHTGSIYADRDPRPFLEALMTVVRTLQLEPQDIQVVFMGDEPIIESRPLQYWAQKIGVGSYVQFRPADSRAEAQRLLATADVAVAFQGNMPTQIPAKIFEYMAFPLWILALVGRESATGELLADTAAHVCEIDDQEQMVRALTSFIERRRAGECAVPINATGEFSRDTQASLLLSRLRQLK